MKGLKLFLSIAVITVVILIIKMTIFSKSKIESHSNSSAEITQNTPTPESGDVKGVSDFIENNNEPENNEKALSCRDLDEQIRAKARQFMEYHVAREARHAINSISAPTTESEKQLYDFLTGEDTEDKTPRLYSLSQFAYTTDSYTLGILEDFGQHTTERGTLACRLQIYEIRTSKSDETFFQESLVRYMIFSITEDSANITDFQGSEDKGKYAGFY